MNNDKDTDRMLGKKLGSYEVRPAKLTFETLHKNYLAEKKLASGKKWIRGASAVLATAGIVAITCFFALKNNSNISAVKNTQAPENKITIHSDQPAEIKQSENATALITTENKTLKSDNTNLSQAENENLYNSNNTSATATLSNNKASHSYKAPVNAALSEHTAPAAGADTKHRAKKTTDDKETDKNTEKNVTVTNSTLSAIAAKRNNMNVRFALKEDHAAKQAEKLSAMAGTNTAKRTGDKNITEQNKQAGTADMYTGTNANTESRLANNKPAQKTNAALANKKDKQAAAPNETANKSNTSTQEGSHTAGQKDNPDKTKPTVEAPDKDRNISAADENTVIPGGTGTKSNTTTADNMDDYTDADLRAPITGPATIAAEKETVQASAPAISTPTPEPANASKKTSGFVIATEVLMNSITRKISPNANDSVAHADLLSGAHNAAKTKVYSGAVLLGFKYKNAGFNTGLGMLNVETTVDTRPLSSSHTIYAMGLNVTHRDSVITYLNDTVVTTFTVVLTRVDTVYNPSGTKTYVVVNGDTVSPQTYISSLRFLTIPLQFNYSFNLFKNKLVLEPQVGLMIGIPQKTYQFVSQSGGELSYNKTQKPLLPRLLFYDLSLKINYRLGRYAFIYLKQGYSFNSKSMYEPAYVLKYTLNNVYTAFGLSVLIN